MHKVINLNFDWYFNETFEDKQLIDYKDYSNFVSVNIPHTICTIPFNNFDDNCFKKVCCYKREIKIKKEYEGREVSLVFEGVGHKSTIYINDSYVACHYGGFDEFSVNISSHLVFGEVNIITVVVDAEENQIIPPFGSFIDFLGYGGIYREVYLKISQKEKINDFFIRTPNAEKSITAFCDIDVSVYPVEIVLTVSDNENAISVNRFSVSKEYGTLEFEVKGKENWTLNNPKLYNVNIKMYSDKKLLDEVNGRFGFRDVKVNKEGFFLNGVKTKIFGLNRQQSYPYVGLAVPQSIEYKDAEILKYELGVNAVRTSHAPCSKHFLDRCDELGIMVIEEIPGWNYIGGDEFQKNVKENIKQMILRDRNHPSVVMWGIHISGALDNVKLMTESVEIATKYDNTRPTFGAHNSKNSIKLEDVFGYNWYEKGMNDLLKNQYLISEHTGHLYPTRIYDSIETRIKQAKNHLEMTNLAYRDDNIIGVLGYSMTDYNSHTNFGSSDRVSYTGVMDMFRNPKEASYIYSTNKEEVVMKVCSNMSRGEYENSKLGDIHIFTNVEYVKMFRNDGFVESFYPCKEKYPNLLHPPIIISDFIGQVLERQEKMSHSDSVILKKLMKKAINKDYKLSFIDRLVVYFILKKYNKHSSYIYELFRKYIIGDVNKKVIYRFDGYVNENVVKSITIGDIESINYVCKADKQSLVVSKTFDSTRIVVKAYDQYNNIVNTDIKAFHIETFGGIDLIGPKDVSLLGGYLAFYVKTNQKSDNGYVCITSDELKFKIDFDIQIMDKNN